jgi:hypothetical protein
MMDGRDGDFTAEAQGTRRQNGEKRVSDGGTEFGGRDDGEKRDSRGAAEGAGRVVDFGFR